MKRRNIYFGLAVLILAGGAVGMHLGKEHGLLVVLKKPLPLRKLLHDLDRDALKPFEVVSTPRLPPEIEDELGTEQYINWLLSDEAARRQVVRRPNLSVTYYTDVQDQVPHVPEECYFQGAFSVAGDEKLEWELPTLGRTVKIRRLAFHPPRDFSKKSIVYYTICVNGDFYSDRQPVRIRMGDWNETHLYYSKVEIAYRDVKEKEAEDVERRAQALMDTVLTELARSHWPPPGSERGQPYEHLERP